MIIGIGFHSSPKESDMDTLMQATGVALWRLQRLDMQEVLIEFPTDAPMEQIHSCIKEIEYWLGVSYKIQCNILDQEQLQFLWAKPYSVPVNDALWDNPGFKQSLFSYRSSRLATLCQAEWVRMQQQHFLLPPGVNIQTY